jgi:dTDP-4-amino-4,6-dideoxygalactose transaminase
MARLHAETREDMLAAFARVLDSGAFVQGGETDAFEREFAFDYGMKHALAVANGTAALHLALLAAGVGPGDEVITVANTFIATVEAISMAGATPVFADVDYATMLIDPADVERKVTARTRAIIPVHLFGRVCDMESLGHIARRYRLKVVEDACQAHGAVDFGGRAGTFGDAGCLSFYPTKNLGTVGEGGMLLTNDDGIAAAVRSLRNHGQSERHVHTVPGYNYRMPELQAAALRVLLPKLGEWNASRIRAAGWYGSGLHGAGVRMPEAGARGSHVYHLYVVRSREREALRQHLAASGIGAAIHYPTPVHLQPAYADLGYGPGSLPVTEHAVDEILSLPMHPQISEVEVEAVCGAVREFSTRGWAVSAAGGA